MAKKIRQLSVVEAALAEFRVKYAEYIEACAIQRAFGGNMPDRSEIDFYFGQKPGIPGIDQIAREVEAELLGGNASSHKAA